MPLAIFPPIEGVYHDHSHQCRLGEQMTGYIIRIQVVESTPLQDVENIVLSIDSVRSVSQLGVVITWAQRLVTKANELMAIGGQRS